MSVDYVTAATAALEASPSTVEGSTVNDAGTTPTIPGETPAVETSKSEEPAEPAKPDRITKGFEDLAREKAALRAEREKFKSEAKGREETLAEARELVEAGKKGDALALLKAAKIPWSKAAQQVLDGTASSDAPAAPAKEEASGLRAELDAIKAELAATKEAKAYADVLSQVQTKAKDPRFKRVDAMGVHGEVMQSLKDYFAETGEMPGETLEESIEIMLETVERRHEKMAEKYRPFLTSAAEPVNVPSRSEVPGAVGAKSQSAAKTLKNSDGSGPQAAAAAPKKPMTDAEYQAAAIQAITAQ